MAKPKTGLGRGLDALVRPSQLLSNVEFLNIELVTPNPRQPRLSLDQATLQELADSIREHGVIQPLLVTEVPAPEENMPVRYQLIAGERRWRAAKLAGFTKVPALIKEATAQETLELALIENLQRSDLNPLEGAMAYRQLVEDFGLTQEEIAKKMGKQRTTVANSLRLLNLGEGIKQSLSLGEISEGHARALLGLADPNDQWELWQRILAEGLNVRQTEEAVRRWPRHKRPKQEISRLHSDAETRHMENQFRATLGTKTTLLRGRKGGRLIIHFYSVEELQQVYDIIVKQNRDAPSD